MNTTSSYLAPGLLAASSGGRVCSLLSKVLRGARQAAATGDAPDTSAAVTEPTLLTCIALCSLYHATRLTARPPGLSCEAFLGASVPESLVAGSLHGGPQSALVRV